MPKHEHEQSEYDARVYGIQQCYGDVLSRQRLGKKKQTNGYVVHRAKHTLESRSMLEAVKFRRKLCGSPRQTIGLLCQFIFSMALARADPDTPPQHRPASSVSVGSKRSTARHGAHSLNRSAWSFRRCARNEACARTDGARTLSAVGVIRMRLGAGVWEWHASIDGRRGLACAARRPYPALSIPRSGGDWRLEACRGDGGARAGRARGRDAVNDQWR